jgi:hypothetical protein
MASKRIGPLCSISEIQTVALNLHRLMDRSEVDKYFGIPKRFLENAACKGGGPAFVKFGRLARYRVADLLDWIDKNRFENTSQVGQSGGAG